jgi:undecaprenyl-diphosphatase
MAAPATALIARFDRLADAPFRRLRGNRVADRVLYTASEAGNFSLIWHALAWAPVAVAPTPRRVVQACSTSAALAAESALVNGPVKSVFRRERPVHDDPEPRPHRLRTPRTSSFPSGHASAATVAVMMLGRRRGPAAKLALTGLATIVASSRVHVRIHHASDVAGGVAVGYVLGRVLRRLLP